MVYRLQGFWHLWMRFPFKQVGVVLLFLANLKGGDLLVKSTESVIFKDCLGIMERTLSILQAGLQCVKATIPVTLLLYQRRHHSITKDGRRFIHLFYQFG